MGMELRASDSKGSEANGTLMRIAPLAALKAVKASLLQEPEPPH
jgi:ADP-ribosylglycohydrolase